jgi:hypothetical protein
MGGRPARERLTNAPLRVKPGLGSLRTIVGCSEGEAHRPQVALESLRTSSAAGGPTKRRRRAASSDMIPPAWIIPVRSPNEASGSTLQ